MQIENEFGFVGPDENYLRHLHTLARDNLVDDVVLFSTDPPAVIDKGSLGGGYSYACVPFPVLGCQRSDRKGRRRHAGTGHARLTMQEWPSPAPSPGKPVISVLVKQTCHASCHLG